MVNVVWFRVFGWVVWLLAFWGVLSGFWVLIGLAVWTWVLICAWCGWLWGCWFARFLVFCLRWCDWFGLVGGGLARFPCLLDFVGVMLWFLGVFGLGG